MFKIKQPGNLASFVNFFAVVTNIETVNTEEIVNEIMYLPESDPVSLNF